VFATISGGPNKLGPKQDLKILQQEVGPWRWGLTNLGPGAVAPFAPFTNGSDYGKNLLFID
jgi:hypothetical protein